MELFLNPLAGIAFFLATIICLLTGLLLLVDSIWRVEERFDRYLKLILVTFVLFLLKKVLSLVGFEAFGGWTTLEYILDLGAALFFLLAQIRLFSMVRSLSGESMKSSGSDTAGQ